MAWEELLMLHWPVDAVALQSHLPVGVQVDTFAGSAWLGIVPFRMTRTRLRRLPPVPTAYQFLELNVRSYVRVDGKPGVWFFSLDAESRLAVEGARWRFGLPYFKARMQSSRRGERRFYTSERRDGRAPVATFAADWGVTGPALPATPGSLPHFLVERYCLFAQRRGQLVGGDIVHAPWQLAPVDVNVTTNDMARLLALELRGPPTSAFAALPLTIAAWSPLACS